MDTSYRGSVKEVFIRLFSKSILNLMLELKNVVFSYIVCEDISSFNLSWA